MMPLRSVCVCVLKGGALKRAFLGGWAQRALGDARRPNGRQAKAWQSQRAWAQKPPLCTPATPRYIHNVLGLKLVLHTQFLASEDVRVVTSLQVRKIYVFLGRVQQTVSGNTSPQYSPLIGVYFGPL